MLEQILELAKQKIEPANDLTTLQHVRVEFISKNSQLSQETKKFSTLSAEEKKEVGIKINFIRSQIQDLLETKQTILEDQELQQRLASEKIDISIPARSYPQGGIHPITQALEELIQIFAKFGFMIKDGPSIETEWYNFTALNINENHPARQLHDTFYLKGSTNQSLLLRTHTSPIQIRTMQNSTPPLRIIAPGRTYRSDSDSTHTPMFHQIEGLVIDKDINMGHLKYVITEFITHFFEQENIEFRFRPHFFPFTEPSVEVDIRPTGSNKWLEVLGCGMVHPKVLENVQVDPNEYQGFAFGLGVERFAMLKYGIKDLRQFFEGDIRWLKHYSFSAFDIPTLAGGLTR